MSKNKKVKKSRFKFVLQNDNSIVLKSNSSRLPKVILHPFDEEDVRHLNEMSRELSSSYKNHQNSLLKKARTFTEFLMG